MPTAMEGDLVEATAAAVERRQGSTRWRRWMALYFLDVTYQLHAKGFTGLRRTVDGEGLTGAILRDTVGPLAVGLPSDLLYPFLASDGNCVEESMLAMAAEGTGRDRTLRYRKARARAAAGP